LPINQINGYTITGYRLEFVGICRECREKEQQIEEMK
jgi:Fe2+ or Zn2+ uptake regulation protein